MTSTLRIDRRFRGPPASGNGGYVAGYLAREIGGYGCVVTLKAAPPLDRELRVERSAAGVSLWAGDVLVAEAAPCAVDLDVPPPPSLAEAEAAAARFTGLERHVFPGCFVCGPERGPGDGLRIFPGAIGGPASGVAATWAPDPGLSGDAGEIASEFVWAALDCPGYFAVEKTSGPAVLGRIAVARYRAVRAGEPMIVTGWPIESQGRKHKVGTALHTRDGVLVAAAQATWIGIDASAWQS